MKYEDIIQFLGYSPENESFDRYLTTNGVSERPEVDEDSVDTIALYQFGVYLKFDMQLSYESQWGSAVYPGEMIFSSFQLYTERNDSNFNRYVGKLPFNLSFESTLVDVEKMFGPSTLNHQSGPDNRVHVWYDVEGYTLSASFFLDQSGIYFVDVEKKSIEPPVPFEW